MACEVAASASTGQLVLFHHDPSYTDNMLAGMERTAKSLFAESVAAYEGLEIVLHGASTALPMVAPLSAREREVKYAQNG
jgi:hypothetical protein